MLTVQNKKSLISGTRRPKVCLLPCLACFLTACASDASHYPSNGALDRQPPTATREAPTAVREAPTKPPPEVSIPQPELKKPKDSSLPKGGRTHDLPFRRHDEFDKNELGRLFDYQDLKLAEKAELQFLEGKPGSWRNLDNGRTGQIILLEAAQFDGTLCRSFKHILDFGSRQGVLYRFGCKHDGGWQIGKL